MLDEDIASRPQGTGKTGCLVWKPQTKYEVEAIKFARTQFPDARKLNDDEIWIHLEEMKERAKKRDLVSRYTKSKLEKLDLEKETDEALERVKGVQLQNGVSDMFVDAVKGAVKKMVCKAIDATDVTKDVLESVLRVFEAIPIVIKLLCEVRTVEGMITALLAGVKMLTGRSLIMMGVDATAYITDLVYDYCIPTHQNLLQAGEFSLDNIIDCAKTLLGTVKDVKNSEMMKRFLKLLRYVLSFGIMQSAGLTFEFCNISSAEAHLVQSKYTSKTDFLFTLLESTVWLVERVTQAVRMKTIAGKNAIMQRLSPFLHSSKEYSKWVDTVFRLKEDEQKLCNPEATGVDIVVFLHTLDTAISQGDAMSKYAESETERRTVKAMLSELRLIKARRQTEDASQKNRKAPFAVLVYGDSCVGKSKFCEVLFQYYAALFDLPSDDCYRYVRCFSDEFWSGFKTFKWCIQIDDIALQATKLGVMDKSLAELIQIVNGIPFNPPMAALEDKGKNPINPRFVIATGNTVDLNADAYFSYPLAVRRRLKYIFDVQVKPEYSEINNGMESGMLDPSKIPAPVEGTFPDIWIIRVKVVKAQRATTKGKSDAVLVDLTEEAFTDIGKFLCFFGGLAKSFEANQERDVSASLAMKTTKVCKNCCHVVDFIHEGEEDSCPQCEARTKCVHVVTQSGETEESDDDGYMADEECAHQISILKQMQLEKELHDYNPTEWVEYVVRKLRAGASVPAHDLHEATRIQAGAIADSGIQDQFEGDDFDRLYAEGWHAARAQEHWSWYCFTMGKAVLVEGPKCIFATSLLASRYILSIVNGKIVSTTHQIADSITNLTQALRAKTNTAWTVIDTMARSKAANLHIQWASWTEPLVEYSAYRLAVYSKTRAMEVLKAFGKRLADFFGNPIVTAVTAVLIMIYPMYKATQWLTARKEVSKDLQGAEASAITKDAKDNCWLPKDEFRLHPTDLGNKTTGSKSQGFQETVDRLSHNVVYLELFKTETTRSFCRAICLVGHLYVTTAHSVPMDLWKVHMIDSDAGSLRIHSSMQQLMKRDSFVFDVEHDLAYFEFFMPPKASVLDFLPVRKLTGGAYAGTLIGRDVNGVRNLVSADNAKPKENFVQAPVDRIISSFAYHPGTPTKYGDCGSALVLETGYGVILAGLHQTGAEYSGSTAVAISLDIVSPFVEKFQAQVQGSGPNLCDKGLRPLHYKSVFHELSGQAKIYGSFDAGSFRAGPKTRVQPTFIAKEAQEEGFVSRCLPPVMKGKEPWIKAATPTLEVNGSVDPLVLETVSTAYAQEIIDDLKKNDPLALKEIVVLTDQEAVNGVPGVKFIDKLNRNTSMGFPYKKSKRFFLLDSPNEMFPDGVEFTPEIKAEIAEIEMSYRQGHCVGPIFNACLKDEPLPERKIKSKKTRVFLNGPAAWSVVVRKYLLAFTRCMQNHPELFECAVGMNCNSEQWVNLRKYLTTFGTETSVAGDYAEYDKRMFALMILAAFQAIDLILVAAGWDETDRLVVRCIANDIAYPYVDFQGDLVQFFGSNPSGQPLTVIINCIVNSLYCRIAFLILNPKHEVSSFRQTVKLMTYGDDNAMNVNPVAQWFNHTSIAMALASIGVTYTMADKEAVSRPYINFSEVSFLKRKWKWDDDASTWLAPLEWASIEKMLTMCVASESIAPQAHAVEVITAAQSESWQHGRAVFEETTEKLRRIVHKAGLMNWTEPNTFLTWNQLYERRCRKELGFPTSPM